MNMNTMKSCWIAALALLPLAAQGHAKLTRATPSEGSTVAVAPTLVALGFNEAATLTALSIQKEGDKAPQKLGPLPKAPAAQFTVALPKLTPGSYVVRYRVLSDDSHVMAGTLKFTLAAPGK